MIRKLESFYGKRAVYYIVNHIIKGPIMRRKKMSRKASRRNFSKGTRVKSRNVSGRPMRGGIRL